MFEALKPLSSTELFRLTQTDRPRIPATTSRTAYVVDGRRCAFAEPEQAREAPVEAAAPSLASDRCVPRASGRGGRGLDVSPTASTAGQ